MTLITSTMLADMHARRENGESVADIAARYNVKPMAAYQRLRRTYGLHKQRAVIPTNDNNPDRTTHLAPHNGGCSTLSGLMPVSLPRVLAAANDNDEDLAAGQAVNDYALRGGLEVQVAA
ncbi:hypothetical protein [Agrobacterium pusense]|uniref:hypothetical protein n=1 Tax=Agrobacterium pusense TaxID=648995 RepID=UPI000512EE06|nr:hypothetical protein [Agrobacterium pusense]ANV24469.1 hypothetical protein BA939_11340 [Rhizobium sp. S41]KGE81465.1 hypothetical protein LW14_17635 [Rhizobium sp. H41]QWW74128.1 hypothetical protein KP800_01050 [Agrobacterium pusense]